MVLTALINAMILLPFIFLFSPSAFINDKFSRTNVIRYSSLAAVVISAGILLSYMTGMFAISFVLTLILAAQSAVYSPAKYSIIKSIVGTENIGMANGVIQALTIVAILFRFRRRIWCRWARRLRGRLRSCTSSSGSRLKRAI